MTTVNDHLDHDVPAGIGRRRFLQAGGAGIGLAALVAACGGTESGLARVGNAPTTTALPDPVINDGVLLRTAASFERSIVAVYERALDEGMVASGMTEVITRLRDDHAAHAEAIDALTTGLGAEAFTCGNPRLDEYVVAPVMQAITGDDAAGIAASDDAQRDLLNFAHGLETLSGSTYQAMMTTLSDPALRKEVIATGAAAARRASVLAMAITGTPAGYVAQPAEGDPPVIPVAYAIPSEFGSLAATTVVVGAANDVGARPTFTLETPSLNTFVYDYLGCDA